MSDRDRRLAEAMGIYKWFAPVPDFTLPEWRARLMDWAVEQEWWDSFATWVGEEKHEGLEDFTAYLWRNLPDLINSYWQERGK